MNPLTDLRMTYARHKLNLRYIYNKCYLVFCLVLLVIPIYSQDALFSQFFDGNRTFTNPAFTGIDGGLSLQGTYRNHWMKIPGVFETNYGSIQADAPCINSAFGLHLLHDKEGEGNLNTVNAAFDYVYVLKFTQTNNLRLGVSANWSQKWVDWDKLIFSDQLDYRDGILDNSSSMANRMYDERPSALGFKAGIAHRFDIARKGDDIKVSYGIGISNIGNLAFNESTPDGFYAKDPLPWRYSFYAGFILPFMRYEGAGGYEFMIIPHLRYDQQSKIHVTTLGATAHYAGFSLGLFYQNSHLWDGVSNTDAMIGYLGVLCPLGSSNVELGITYDSNNVPKMSNTSLGGLTAGSIEVNVKWLFNNVTFLCGNGKGYGGRRKGVSCPSLMSDYRSRSKYYGNNNNFYRKKRSK